MRHLVDARRDLIAWIVRPDQVTVLMVRENYGSRPDDWLAPALTALQHLTLP